MSIADYLSMKHHDILSTLSQGPDSDDACEGCRQMMPSTGCACKPGQQAADCCGEHLDCVSARLAARERGISAVEARIAKIIDEYNHTTVEYL